MPPKSSFLSKFSKQTSYEIVETPSQDPKRPSSWHYRKVSASSEPAPRKPSSVLDFVPEDSYTAQAKSEELHDLFQEVEQLYSAEKYSNVAFDDLPVVKPAPPGKTPSPLNRYIISRLASPKPANVKADETSLFKLPFLGEVRTLTSEKSSPTKALQRRNARQTPPPKGPETPAPLNLFPRNTPPRKPVPPNPRLGCGRAKDLEKPVLVSSLQSKNVLMPPLRTSKRQKALDNARNESRASLKDGLDGNTNLGGDVALGADINPSTTSGDPTISTRTNQKKLQRSTKKKDFFADEKWLFSAKSKLSDTDLTAYFQKPLAWDSLDNLEKDKIRSLLPANIPTDANGRPSLEFLKYDNDWRNGIRQFQVDLAAGRYEPEWLEQAAEAMTKRASGDFDDWKAEQFEEFWGQKKKLSEKDFTAEMARVTLVDLIIAKKFQEGDVFSYVRTFGRGKQAFLVEKDIKIVTVTNTLFDQKLIFAIPPGQLKFFQPIKPLPPLPPGSSQPSSPVAVTGINTSESIPLAIADKNSSELKHSTSIGLDSLTSQPELKLSTAANFDLITTPPPRFDSLPKLRTQDALMTQENDKIVADKQTPDDNKAEHSNATHDSIRAPDVAKSSDMHSNPLGPNHSNATTTSVQSLIVRANALSSPLPDPFSDPVHRSPTPSKRSLGLFRPNSANADSPTLPSSSTPRRSLTPRFATPSTDQGEITCTAADLLDVERKILEVDGRLKAGRWDDRGDVWKAMRCSRGDQDLGTLWDMRRKYWLSMNPYTRV